MGTDQGSRALAETASLVPAVFLGVKTGVSKALFAPAKFAMIVMFAPARKLLDRHHSRRKRSMGDQSRHCDVPEQ